MAEAKREICGPRSIRKLPFKTLEAFHPTHQKPQDAAEDARSRGSFFSASIIVPDKGLMTWEWSGGLLCADLYFMIASLEPHSVQCSGLYGIHTSTFDRPPSSIWGPTFLSSRRHPCRSFSILCSDHKLTLLLQLPTATCSCLPATSDPPRLGRVCPSMYHTTTLYSNHPFLNLAW